MKNLRKRIPLILVFLGCIGTMMADITITVPKKWKGKTIYVWQTDIQQAFNRQDDEPLNQVKDTIKIKELTFTIPNKLDCATKINVITPKKDETDYDHTIAEACVMPGEDVHLFLDNNSVRAEGSRLNQQMAEIYSYYMPSMEKFKKAYSEGDKDKLVRVVNEIQQWYVDWIKANPSAPGASYALYQISDPKLIVEYADMLQGDALNSMFYHYTENSISRAKQILQRKVAQQALNEEKVEAPNFSLNDLNGNSVSLTDFRGKWVILDFWGSWCAPCLKGMPELKEIYQQYGGRIEIIGVDCNDSEESWRNAVARLELPWISVYQPEDGTVTKAYSVSAFPTKVVINPNGKIQKIYSGASPTFKDDLADWLK